MTIKHNGKQVDALDKQCPKRTCFQLGQDKGTFVAGRGYTSYHKEPRWVCLRRHLHGCPSAGVCANCNHSYVELETECRQCGQPLVK